MARANYRIVLRSDFNYLVLNGFLYCDGAFDLTSTDPLILQQELLYWVVI